MKTAGEMYQYCITNKTGTGSVESWAIKHFKVIEDMLQPNEVSKVCFIGLHNYKSATQHEQNYAYALTNERLLMAQKKMIGQKFKSVYLDNLNDIGLSSGIINHNLTIDTIKEVITVNFNTRESAENVYNLSHKYIQNLKSPQTQTQESPSILDEIKKAYTLFEQGIITEEEFEKIKSDALA